jgi:hypothetical protein
MKELTNYKRVTGYLDKIYKLLNQEYFSNELPPVVLTIQSTPKAYGHFTLYDAWHVNENGFREINIGAGTLDRPIENVVATLLHEMVHHYCFIHQIKDTSRGGTYHNKKFRDEATQRGLLIDYDTRIGWSITTPSENLIDFCISNDLKDIQIARNDFESFRIIGGTSGRSNGNPGVPTTGKGASHSIKYICPCCGNIARTTKVMNLICGDCHLNMKPA